MTKVIKKLKIFLAWEKDFSILRKRGYTVHNYK